MTYKSQLTFKERLLISWISPKGIVAAAIAALFSEQLREYGYAEPANIVTASFIIICLSILWQSLTANIVAKTLRLSRKKHSYNHVLVIGNNVFSKALESLLVDIGFNVTRVSQPKRISLDNTDETIRPYDLSLIEKMDHIFLINRSESLAKQIVISFVNDDDIFHCFTSKNSYRFHQRQYLAKSPIIHGDINPIMVPGEHIFCLKTKKNQTLVDIILKHPNKTPLFHINHRMKIKSIDLQRNRHYNQHDQIVMVENYPQPADKAPT